MLGTIPSCALFGIDAFPVVVEVDVAGGLPTYRVVGMPATAVREGGERIRAALESIGHELPQAKIIVNLAPADRRKDGAAFDLPIAIAALAANQKIDLKPLRDVMMLGELGLDGSVRPVRGALAAATLATRRGLRGIVLPSESAAEAAAVEGIDVYGVDHVGDVVAALQGTFVLPRVVDTGAVQAMPSAGDFSDIRGQAAARMALEVAIAGGHNVLLAGPPGIGKTMLARRLPSILPPLSRDEAIETTKIYSAVGLSPGGLVRARPFRAPHHSISTAALVGGGSPPHPGEISLAHNGVLFLDELPEFQRAAVESMRQPLEDRMVTIARASGAVSLPASFLLIAAANPCPCGWLGSRDRACTCSLGAVERYRSRLSGPLLDRIDLQIHVPNIELADLRSDTPGESSAVIRERVLAARARQSARLAAHGVRTNAEMSSRTMRATCKLDDEAERTLARMHEVRAGMTGRTVDRIIKVARTIADLSAQDDICAGCILEAASYRAFELDPIADPRDLAVRV